jgi:mannose-6-phosphate isomerase-like protein (cupin superfamily)
LRNPELESEAEIARGDAQKSSVIGNRVRIFRTARRMSLRQLGELTDTTASFISQMERGLSGVNTSTLMRIANALGISVSDLFDDEPRATLQVLKLADRPSLPVSEGYRKTLLSRRPIHEVEVYAGEFAVGGSTGDKPYSHGDAHEMFIVLKGSVELTLGEDIFVLDQGDSIEYPTSTPHKTVNIGNEPAEVLWIIAPPTSGAGELNEYITRKPLASGHKQDGESS